METFQELRDKVKGLGFEEYSFYTFCINTGRTIMFNYKLDSLNISFNISEKEKDIHGKNIVFYFQNSEFEIGRYNLQEAYEKIENEFKEKLSFKAFNSHLFKEVDIPQEVNEMLYANTAIFNLMVRIENNTRLNNKPIWREDSSFSENLINLHNLSFYNTLEDSRNIAILNTYKAFIKSNFGIILEDNKIPKDLPSPKEYSVLEYLRVVAAYQLLLKKEIIKED